MVIEYTAQQNYLHLHAKTITDVQFFMSIYLLLYLVEHTFTHSGNKLL